MQFLTANRSVARQAICRETIAHERGAGDELLSDQITISDNEQNKQKHRLFSSRSKTLNDNNQLKGLILAQNERWRRG